MKREEFDHRGEPIGQTTVEFHLLTLLALQSSLLRKSLQLLVNLDKTSRLVKQRAHTLRLGLHHLQQLADSRETDNRLAELAALLCIFQGLAVGRFARADRLRTNTQTGGIHKRHDVFDKAHTTVTTNSAGASV